MKQQKQSVENNIEITNLYQCVWNAFDTSSESLFKAKEMIENCDSIKKPTKKKILDKFEEIFKNRDEIINSIGKIGKIR